MTTKTQIFIGMLVAACLAAAVLPAAAGAHCTSSTPASTSFADSSSDGHHIAPEIATVVVSVDAACHYTVDLGIAKPLREDSVVTVLVDTDDRRATGVTRSGGADIAVMTEAIPGMPRGPFIGAYDPWSNHFDFEGRRVTRVGNGGFTATLDQLGIAQPTTTRVRVVTMGADEEREGVDLAPELNHGSMSLPLGFAFDDTPTPPLLPPGCTVPDVTHFTQGGALRILRAAGCEVLGVQRHPSTTVPRGHVIVSDPRAGRRWRQGVILTVSGGPGPKHAHRR